MQTIYKCENCGQEFGDWQVCSAHENKHLKIKSSRLVFPLYDIQPTAIVVELSDGSIGRFELAGVMAFPDEENSLPAIGSSAEGHEK